MEDTQNQQSQKIQDFVHSYRPSFDTSAQDGATYLKYLPEDCARIFFEHAEKLAYGNRTPFMTDRKEKFMVVYNYSDGTYSIEKAA